MAKFLIVLTVGQAFSGLPSQACPAKTERGETMNPLHPYIPLFIAGLILFGASSVGPDSVMTSPVGESISPAMATDHDAIAVDIVSDLSAMTPGSKWGPLLWPKQESAAMLPNGPVVTAADPRIPMERSNDNNESPGFQKQAAILSPMVRLKNAGGHGVHFRDDAWLTSKKQRMLHSNASTVV